MDIIEKIHKIERSGHCDTKMSLKRGFATLVIHIEISITLIKICFFSKNLKTKHELLKVQEPKN